MEVSIHFEIKARAIQEQEPRSWVAPVNKVLTGGQLLYFLEKLPASCLPCLRRPLRSVSQLDGLTQLCVKEGRQEAHVLHAETWKCCVLSSFVLWQPSGQAFVLFPPFLSVQVWWWVGGRSSWGRQEKAPENIKCVRTHIINTVQKTRI